MKKTNKFFALFLSLILLIGTVMPVYAFDEEKIEKGELTPVFFGSALTNFGVKTFLDAYLQFAPAPLYLRMT